MYILCTDSCCRNKHFSALYFTIRTGGYEGGNTGAKDAPEGKLFLKVFLWDGSDIQILFKAVLSASIAKINPNFIT